MKLLAALGVMLGALTASPVSHETLPPTTTTVPPLVSATDMAQWGKVAWCETHSDWDRNEPNADGGLGIDRVNWVTYGGLQFAPAPHLATPEQQVYIAKRINAGYDVPDQNGECEAW